LAFEKFQRTLQTLKEKTKSQRRAKRKSDASEQQKKYSEKSKRKFREYKQRMKKQQFKPRTAEQKVSWSKRAALYIILKILYYIKKKLSQQQINQSAG
jgi:hypothetical protein